LSRDDGEFSAAELDYATGRSVNGKRDCWRKRSEIGE